MEGLDGGRTQQPPRRHQDPDRSLRDEHGHREHGRGEQQFRPEGRRSAGLRGDHPGSMPPIRRSRQPPRAAADRLADAELAAAPDLALDDLAAARGLAARAEAHLLGALRLGVRDLELHGGCTVRKGEAR